MRYEHFLKRATGGKFPRCIIAVDCASSVTVHGEQRQVEREQLTQWYAVAMSSSGAVYGRAVERTGTTVHEWREAVDYQCKRGGQVWVVCTPASRILSLIGVWSDLENGTLRVSREDNRVNIPNEDTSVSDVRDASVQGDVLQGSSAKLPVRDVQDGGNGNGTRRTTRKNEGRRKGSGYVVLQDPPTVVCLRSGDRPGTLTYLDCRNWSVEPPQDLSSPHHRARWIIEFMRRWSGEVRRRGWGSLQTTVGSQAMHAFRVKHLRGIVHVHNSTGVLGIEGESLYGGRCEAFRIGTVPAKVYHLDIRSLYPSICVGCRLPSALVRRHETGTWEQISSLKPGRTAIARVTVQTSRPSYPVRRNSSVVWPVGRFQTVLPYPELAECNSSGSLVRIGEWAEYETSYILSSAALDFYNLRRWSESASDRSLADVAKALLVCLPGKFGQRGYRWVDRPDLYANAPYEVWYQPNESGGLTRYRSIAWIVQEEVISEWSDDAVPAISAFVMSYGRMKLLQALRIIGRRDCYYCDTDSVFVSQAGYDSLRLAGLIREGELGFWQLKGVYERMEIHGWKHYEIDGELVCSGLPKGTVERGPDEFTYWYRKWLQSSPTNGKRPEAERLLRSYSRNDAYRHGVVSPTGMVWPLQIEE